MSEEHRINIRTEWLAPKDEYLGVWRETQDGWAVTLADGMSANIQISKKGLVRYNFMATGACDTVAEARERIDELVSRVVGVDDAKADLVAALVLARRYVVIEWVRAQKRSGEDLGTAERLEKENLDVIDAALHKAGA